VHFQGTVEATWKPVLAQFRSSNEIFPAPVAAPLSRRAIHA
jgi:hypothetical protein